MRWRLLSRRPWSNGIASASVYIGDGNRKREVAGQLFVGDTQAYPRDEHCQSAVGSASDPWRTPKLGVDIGQTSVAKYMVRRRDPPSQGWRTFLRNHADGIAAMDMFVVPTISFRLLMGHARRHILWFGVTAHPTAEWIANQVTEACGWEQAPRYLIRDRDGAYGEVIIRRLRSIGIRDRPTSPRSPWQWIC
jgi:hypothetical protein